MPTRHRVPVLLMLMVMVMVGTDAARHAAVASKRRRPTAAQLRGGSQAAVAGPKKFCLLSPGAQTVLGGFIAHLILGTMYCWGNFIAYIPKELRFYNGQEHPGQPVDATSIIPLTIATMCCLLPSGTRFVRAFGPRAAAVLGGSVVCLSVFLASLAKNLRTFTLCYAVLYGAGLSLAYTAPLSAGWAWFPEQKGLVNGVILAGFGLGGLIFNLVGTRLFNPQGLSPDINGAFPSSVTDRFHPGLRRLAIAYAATTLITLLAGTAGLTTSPLYKVYASTSDTEALRSDSFLATVGAFGALANGVSRLFWGLASDAFGFKRPFCAMLAMQAVTMVAMPKAVALGRAPYLVAVFAAFCGLGGTFAMIPSLVGLTFGAENAAEVYALVFSAFACGVRVARWLIPRLGWDPVFFILAAASCLALALVATLDAP